jgi:hypothetical protein
MSRFERVDYLPTPRQIAAQCAKIRSGWTPAERRRRTVGHLRMQTESTWLPPQIRLSHCVARVRRVVAEASST